LQEHSKKFLYKPTISLNRIAEALIAAHIKGVSVKVLVDRSQLNNKGSQLKRLLQTGIVIFEDRIPGIAHNKVMIIDHR